LNALHVEEKGKNALQNNPAAAFWAVAFYR